MPTTKTPAKRGRPPKWKLMFEKIGGDGISNALQVERTYKIPLFTSNPLYSFRDIEGQIQSTISPKVKFYPLNHGWGDPYCKTIRFCFLLIPNNGRTIYNELKEDDKNVRT